MKKLAVHLHLSDTDQLLIGHLAENKRRVYFEYSAEFLHNPLWLSPFKLPPKSGLHEHRDLDFGPLFGLFDDSLPDGWGLLLMDRALRKRGMNPRAVSPLDRLAYLGSRTMGALSYRPAMDEASEESTLLNLHSMSEEVKRVWQGSVEEVLPQLLQAGGSPGGARPKILVGVRENEIISSDKIPVGFEHWLIKFVSPQDSQDSGLVEYAYSLMARDAGLNMPETRLFESSKGEFFFGIKRFDREEDKRFHVHSFGNLIHSNFRIPNCDYTDLLKTTQILTKNRQDVLAVYRQAIFNVAAHNRDDHVKNFAYIFDPQTAWSNSPVYDLTFCEGPGGEHSMTICGEGSQPTKAHFLNLAKEFGISQQEASSIIDDVYSAVSKWPLLAKNIGVSTKTIAQISPMIKRNLKNLT